MFVHWKTRKLLTYNDRSDTECLHKGPDRWSWTPIIAESVWTPSGPRRRTVLRPSPAIRSCCVSDPFVRVRWWNATAEALERAITDKLGIDIEHVMSKLGERVALPNDEDLLVHEFWPANTRWWTSYGYGAVDQREQVARSARRLAVDRLRPGDGDWEDALAAWEKAEAAFAIGNWNEYVRYERQGLEFIGRAIPKARQRPPPLDICASAWFETFQEHVRRLDERRAQREADDARRCADEKRRREREAEEEQRRTADERRRRARRDSGPSAGPRSVVDRMNTGSAKDWADLLGVTYPCARDELKRAHRAAVVRHHPDRGGDTEMMKAVNVAKDLLEKELAWHWAAGSVQ